MSTTRAHELDTQREKQRTTRRAALLALIAGTAVSVAAAVLLR